MTAEEYCRENSAEKLFNFVTKTIDEIISVALQSLTRLEQENSPPSEYLESPILLRCRSSSRNDRRERQIGFHHTMPRSSPPANRIESFSNHTRSLSYQRTTRINSNRSFDVQYSFSLNKPWRTKIDKQRHQLISIQNFVKQFVEHSIRTALLQIDYQQLTNNKSSIYRDDTSCVLFDCSPSYMAMQRFETISTFADKFVTSTMEQSIEEIRFNGENPIERFATRLTDRILSDSLQRVNENDIYSQSLLTDDEKQHRIVKRRTIESKRLINSETNETTTATPTLFQQIRQRSSSALRLLNNHHHHQNQQQREHIDSLINTFAHKIYVDSFSELRKIFNNSRHSK